MEEWATGHVIEPLGARRELNTANGMLGTLRGGSPDSVGQLADFSAALFRQRPNPSAHIHTNHQRTTHAHLPLL